MQQHILFFGYVTPIFLQLHTTFWVLWSSFGTTGGHQTNFT
jgi:hypothetical protein